VCIVSPALAAANNGNWQTAARWQRFLAPLAPVEIRSHWRGAGDGDVLIALHARRSAASIERFHAQRPRAPIALVLTGTDLYRDLANGDLDARHSIECARFIVVLQEAALTGLDAPARAKARVVVQSARACKAQRRADDPAFVAVGHLRDEKDPVTLMRAAHRLAEDGTAPSKGRSGGALDASIVHIGAALDERLGAEARATMAACPRYRWLGGQPHGATRLAIARARALVHPSRMEGGANVVIEAVRSGVPVLASRIDGNVGLLGAGYDGLFAVGDDAALAALMRRFLRDDAFAANLRAQCAAREPLFTPARERTAVRSLFRDLLSP